MSLWQRLNSFLKIWSSINLSWGHARSHKKIGPDRFSRFDVFFYRNGQTDRQTSQIYILKLCIFLNVLILWHPWMIFAIWSLKISVLMKQLLQLQSYFLNDASWAILYSRVDFLTNKGWLRKNLINMLRGLS